ncbi:Myeloid-associated differentiation marker-like [Oryzias melastigma]|uniref:Myeloid-associated differentiation marker-like n=1 Tax=Oryzias melastigma TaxID=30732 RepID=A0A834CPN8_ORYME|nr:Myeloid-associated differentiation marker-like [Oryzias melastigma]
MSVIELLSSKLFWVRVAALLFSCVAFGVQKIGAFLPKGSPYDWCMFCWMFSFTCTLIVLLVDLCRIHTWIPMSWTNFPITVACYAALFCLSASVIFPLFFLRNKTYLNSKIKDYCIISTVFSCLATVTYLGEVILFKASSREEAGYMASAPGMIKVCQTFVACVIFLVKNLMSCGDLPPSLQWCMAVYCICFILSMAVVLMFVWDCTIHLPSMFPKLLSGHGFLSFVMYLSATILWPMYQFNDQYEDRDYSNKMAVAVFTCLNLLLYIA